MSDAWQQGISTLGEQDMLELSLIEDLHSYTSRGTSNLSKGERGGGMLGGYFVMRSHSAAFSTGVIKYGKRSNMLHRGPSSWPIFV